MKFIRDLIRSKEPTAAALRAALAELPIATAAAAMVSAEERYHGQLLDGEDGPTIEATEREVAAAQREHKRVLAYRDELQAQIVIADQREILDALAAKRDAAEKEAAAVAALFAKRYGPAVDEVVAMVERLEAAEIQVTEANRALEGAGMVDRVQHAEARFPSGQTLVAGRRLRLYLGMEGDLTQPEQPR